MADNSFSLINLDGIGELAQSLLEKISKAVGWIVTRDTPKRIALQTYIEDIKSGNYDPITRAVLISNANKTIAEYTNQNIILQHAIDNMKTTANPKQVADDWISQFMDKARLVSDSEFQLIWGRILAEECNAPGSVPRSLLHTLEQMDKNDAERFTTLCSFSVSILDRGILSFSPVIIGSHLKEYYAKNGLNLNALVDLRSLGLIEMDFGLLSGGYSLKFSTHPVNVQYFEKHYLLPELLEEVPVGNVIFTKTGQALCQAITVEEQEDFFAQYCIPFWKNAINNDKLP